MKLSLVLGSMLPFWLMDCSIIDQKKTRFDDLGTLWAPVIAYLNQAGSIKTLAHEDLMEIYQQELAGLEQQWALKTQHSKRPELEKHEFFHNEIEKLNQQELAKLDQSTANNDQIAASVLKAVESHPTATSKKALDYDQSGQVGFCFGRALLTHYYLLKAGVLPKDIFKIFAVGDLMLGGQFWQFHVAVMIKSRQGLLVVDPLYGELASVKDWMANVKSLEIKHPLSRARFFVTDPRKFIPTSSIYRPKDFSRTELSAYFYDLVKSLN